MCIRDRLQGQRLRKPYQPQVHEPGPKESDLRHWTTAAEHRCPTGAAFQYHCVGTVQYLSLIHIYGVNGCVAVFFVPIFKYDDLKFFQISIIWYICSIIETNMAKVIHVHLLHKIDGTKQKDWYFSSISAVYTVLTADQVGATKNYLLHAGLSGNGTICTKKAIICLLYTSRCV